MAKKVSIWLEQKNIGDSILKNNTKLQSLEQHAIQSALSAAEAQFLSQFGFQGKFEIQGFVTNRYNFKLVAADRRTAAVLKKHPGWLSKFVDNMKIG